jgi:hypothetical protein
MLGAGAAVADEPGSMSEAEAMGDPAASAPSVDAPDVFIYQGDEISEKTASELELACVQSVEQYNCKDSEDEFGSGSAARASKAKSKKGASASAACGVVELWLYQHKQYGGWANGVYQYYTWFNLGPGYNNETSSYRTGTASAHMSDFADGGGYWYPGATGYCDYHSNILQPFPEWNDRISSRYRL